MNDLKKKLELLSQSELSKIIEGKELYSAKAIEMAKEELKNRNLIQDERTTHFQKPELDETSENTINIISILFALLFGYRIYSSLDFLQYIFLESNTFSIHTLLFLVSTTMLTLGIIFFWKRQKIGWILLTTFSANVIFGQVTSIMSIFGEGYGLSMYDFPIAHLAIDFIIFGGLLWALSSIKIRKTYQIASENIGTVIAILLILNITVFFSSINYF